MNRIITFIAVLTISISLLPADTSGFRFVSGDNDYTEIAFTMPDFITYEVEQDGIKYVRFYDPVQGLVMEEGLPELLTYSFLLAVPETGTIELDNVYLKSFEVIENINVFPSQGFNLEIDEEKGFIKNKDFYLKDINYPVMFPGLNKQTGDIEGMVNLSSPAIMRDLRLITVEVRPFSYNPYLQQLTIAGEFTIRISYNQNEPGKNELNRAPRRLSRTFEQMQRKSVINYEQFRNPATRNDYQKRSMIIVHHHSTNVQYRTPLNNFINWKRDKGFEVTAIDTDNYRTNTAIKNFIQNAYNNWENPPEYVIMIGDLNSAFSVPMWFDPQQDAYQAGTAITDHPYSLLEGNDHLSDVIVGRISISTALQLATYWNKVLNYEKYPYMAETDWYNHNLLVGEANMIGISALFTTRYINDVIRRYNREANNTQLTSPPYPAPVQNALNNGATFTSIRCWYNLGGWNPGENEYTNGYKLSHLTVLTCHSMAFNVAGGMNLGGQFRYGTPVVSRGFLSALGMSHVTDTAFNNLMTAAVFDGLFKHDMWTMGEAKVYSKLEHYRAFWNSHPWRARHYFYMMNLKGDPSLDVWKGVPKTLNADYRNNLPFGSNSISITITDENDEPIEDAWVTIRQVSEDGEEDVFVTGYTNTTGRIVHYFSGDAVGDVNVTVTKPGYKPHIGEFTITAEAGVTFNRIITNQDFDAGERVGFILTAYNHRNTPVQGVNGTISVNSDYVNIVENNSGFGNIAARGEAESVEQFVIEISAHTPQGYRPDFQLTITDNNQNSWISHFNVPINNGKLQLVELVIVDNDDGILDPLEQAMLRFHLRNTGNYDLDEIYGALTGGGYGLTIVSDTAYFGNIEQDETVTSRERHITVATSGYVIPGMIYNLDLQLFNESGFSQTIPVRLNIGTVTVNDPLGPCPYGYWIYDCGDELYFEAPEYEWIEISPQLGGNGVNANITSDFNNSQGNRTMDLPFTFRFYGEEYDVVTISANGWITFKQTELSFHRNWRLPGPLGAEPKIAAFWDNLSLADGAVFTWFDEEEQLFVIQWQNARNVQANAQEIFQIILYNPEYHFTSTTDGPIKIQYKVFNNVNNRGGTPGGNQSQYGEWGNYCTIGIADHTGLIGLEYTFNNQYPTAARRLGNETAIYITTGSLGFVPYIVIDEVIYSNEDDNIPKFGDTGNLSIRLHNMGGEEAFGIRAELESDDEYVTILQNTADYGDIDSEAFSIVNNAFTISISDRVPDGHRIVFLLTITTQDELLTWRSVFFINAAAPKLTAGRAMVFDPHPGGNNNGLIDPGENVTIYLPLINSGGASSSEVNLSVTCEDQFVQITEISETSYNSIYSNDIMYPAISVSISDLAEQGTGISFDYEFTTGNYSFTGSFLLGVGGVVPAQIGAGEEVSALSSGSPVNLYFRTLRGQSVYTAEELQNAGLTGGGTISSLGFFVFSAPHYALPNFVVRMKHTNATDASRHIDGPYQTVYFNESYAPDAGNWHIMLLDEPFEWNGVDNILIDTAFAPVPNWHNSGQVRIYEVENGYRFTRADTPDQTDVETNTVTNDKPQVILIVDTGAGDVATRPENLTAVIVDSETIALNWNEPQQDEGLLGYNIYLNGTRINEQLVIETEYENRLFDGTVMNYYFVRGVFEDIGEGLSSNIATVNFNITLPPVIEPEAGIYYQPVNVTITSMTVDAEIRYTLDGSEPTGESSLFENPFDIIFSAELKAKAFKEGLEPSETVKADFTILYAPRNLSVTGTLEELKLTWEKPLSPDSMLCTTYNGRLGRYPFPVQRTARTLSFSCTTDGSDVTSITARRSVVRATGHCPVPSPVSMRRKNPDRNSDQPEQAYSSSNTRERRNEPDRDFDNMYISRDLIGYNVFRSYEQEDFSRQNEEILTNLYFIDASLEAANYRYYVTAVYEQGESLPSQIISVGPTFVDEEEVSQPLSTELHRAYPNPFNPETTIEFTLREESQVTIEIFSITGRKVNTLVNEPFPAGRHRIIWQGLDENRNRLSSGVYFYRMTTDEYTKTRKVLMLK